MRTRLLCATDLTARSDGALLRTRLLAEKLNAEVMFVHAVNDSQSGRVLRMKVNRAKVRLIIAARRPLLAVGSTAQAPYGRVVLASDLSATSAYAARAASEMKMFANANTWAVHAFDPAFPGLVAADERTERLVDEHKRRLRQEVQSELLGQLREAGIEGDQVQLSIQAAEPVAAIQNVIEHVRPDLLVIGVSRWAVLKRMLIGSVANHVLQRINCDILAIAPPRVRNTLLKAA
jgi:nucleotide-binding universal stress UspA family protein